MTDQKQNSNSILAWLWIGFGVVARVIPHIPNFTPSVALCLFSGTYLGKRASYLAMLLMLVISDCVIALWQGISPFGWWSVFTYTGFAAVTFLGSRLQSRMNAGNILGFTISSSLLFWVWTNFGTWLSSGMYPRTSAGLMECYTMAIPFLEKSLLGDLVWTLVFFLSYSWIRQFTEKQSLAKAPA